MATAISTVEIPGMIKKIVTPSSHHHNSLATPPSPLVSAYFQSIKCDLIIIYNFNKIIINDNCIMSVVIISYQHHYVIVCIIIIIIVLFLY